jgi:hypothetical protein
VLEHVMAHRFPVEPGRRHVDDERVFPRPLAGREGVVELRVAVRPQLVDDHETGVQAVLQRPVRGEDPEDAAVGFALNDAAIRLQPVLKLRAGLHEPFRLVEHDPRLLGRRSGGVHLRRVLPGRQQPVQRDPGRQGALAVLAGDAQHRFAVDQLDLAGRGGALQERLPQPVMLPRLQPDGLTRPPALRLDNPVLHEPGDLRPIAEVVRRLPDGSGGHWTIVRSRRPSLSSSSAARDRRPTSARPSRVRATGVNA